MSKSRNTQKLEVDGLDSVSTCTSFVFSFPVFLPTLIPVSHEVSKLARPKPTAKNDSSLQQSRADDMPVRGSLSFFFFWLHWVFVAACGLSLVAASRGYSSLRCTDLLRWLLLLWSMGSRHAGFSSCSTWAQ